MSDDIVMVNVSAAIYDKSRFLGVLSVVTKASNIIIIGAEESLITVIILGSCRQLMECLCNKRREDASPQKSYKQYVLNNG
jgi:hypothetical protein